MECKCSVRAHSQQDGNVLLYQCWLNGKVAQSRHRNAAADISKQAHCPVLARRIGLRWSEGFTGWHIAAVCGKTTQEGRNPGLDGADIQKSGGKCVFLDLHRGKY